MTHSPQLLCKFWQRFFPRRRSVASPSEQRCAEQFRKLVREEIVKSRLDKNKVTVSLSLPKPTTVGQVRSILSELPLRVVDPDDPQDGS